MLVFNQAVGPWKFLRYRARLRRAYSIMLPILDWTWPRLCTC